jgi:hypothetical protein
LIESDISANPKSGFILADPLDWLPVQERGQHSTSARRHHRLRPYPLPELFLRQQAQRQPGCQQGSAFFVRLLRNAGGIVIRVKRGPEPVWYELAQTVNCGPDRNINWRLSKNQLETYGIHASETGWIGTEFDAVIDNNSDGLDNLYAQIKRLVQDLQQPRADQS